MTPRPTWLLWAVAIFAGMCGGWRANAWGAPLPPTVPWRSYHAEFVRRIPQTIHSRSHIGKRRTWKKNAHQTAGR